MTTYRVTHNVLDRLLTRMVYLQAIPLLGHVVRTLLYLAGVNVPRAVRIGEELLLVHCTAGLVLHSGTWLGDRVTLLHNVTLGRSDPWVRGDTAIVVGDDVIIGAGAAVLARSGTTLNVGAGTVVGANAVLTVSTGEWEIWAGNPAHKVGDRESRA